MLLVTTRFNSPEQLENHINSVVDIRQRTSKPVLAILSYSFSPEEVEQAGNIIQKLQDGGVPTFSALERGASALKNALDYYNLKSSAGA